jgi:Asp-tRNA(Asn)/Glu-tRNA(Gln) amidotransferase A subunit family amidase
MQYAFLANLTGNPAITVPAGFADVTEEVDGGKFLPAGIQFMAAHFREDLLFRCAFVTEQLVERKDPSLVVNVLPQK